ncbi:MAG: 16S rRNA (cytidine(1402)-2'-O)-methyltransferase [Anaerolineales bacterium]|nr:16S rRNA (cytidine(1402)-2'-O)-methyltransferase [Anaerolineales bacterium]
MGTLFLVATPIGNLEDIGARALRVLGQVELIAAEDTRQTRKLLDHYGIRTPQISYHEHNKLRRLDEVLAALARGDVALVSDAGTPALNDPGYELVRAALEAGYPISPLPGPCAPIAALVASGLPTDAFLYLGYLPRRSAERRRLLAEVGGQTHTLVFLEAPHRLLESLQDLLHVLGDRPAAVARELTKLHEEIFRGKVSEALAHFTDQAPRGEFTLVIGGAAPQAGRWSEDRLRAALRERLAGGAPASRIAAETANLSGWPRREVYRLLTELGVEEKNVKKTGE